MASKSKGKPSRSGAPTTPSTAAPPERWRHGAEREPEVARAARQVAQRVRRPVDTLLAGGKIGLADVHAATRWLRDYELGIHGARDPEMIGNGSGSPDGVPVAVCDALSRHREATLAVGKLGDRLLVLAIAQCRTLSAISELLQPGKEGRNSGETTGLLVGTLSRLTDHYEAVDSREKPKAWADRAPYHDQLPRKRATIRAVHSYVPSAAGSMDSEAA